MNNRLALATVLAMLVLSVFLDGLLPLNMPTTTRELVFGAAAETVPARGLQWEAVAIPGLSGQYGGFGVAGTVAGFGKWGGGGFAEAVHPLPVVLSGKGAAAASSPLPYPPRQGNTEQSKEVNNEIFDPESESASMVILDTHRTSSSQPRTSSKLLPALTGRGIATWYGGNTERSKEASDGMGSSECRSSSMVVSGTHCVSGSDGAGLADQVAARVAVRGVATQGIATFYHPSLAGNVMRDNVTIYQRDMSGVVASVSWPLGAILYACGPSGRCLQVEVRDTGLLGENAIDASEADFRVLSGRGLAPGVLDVEIRVLEEGNNG